ncbi:MAG TPA: zinc ribbon domain-containing protein [Solirubrobacteraceae bacterium]|nr:zinc ribbon domain-containing protein [Solirubrobacteraceae bacterium]
MSAPGQLQISPVAATIDNAADWPQFAQQLQSQSGVPPAVTPELIAGMLGSAVPLLFEADATANAELLRGTFADSVIAQCARHPGNLMGERPLAVTAHLAGARVQESHQVVRVHLAIAVKTASGGEALSNQFWDLQLGAQVTVGQTTCPNCGGPIPEGQLICTHCGTDVRSVAQVPLVVSQLELY